MPNSRKRHYSPSRSRSSDHSNDQENKRKRYDEKSHDEGHRNNRSNDNYSSKGSLSSEKEVASRSTEDCPDIEKTSLITMPGVKDSNTEAEYDTIDLTDTIVEGPTNNIEQTGTSTETDKNEDFSIRDPDSAVTTTEKQKCTVEDSAECEDQNESEDDASKSKVDLQDLDKSTSEDDKTNSRSVKTSFTTPKKMLTPKKLQQKLESEKKRLERQKEKEEKEKKKNAEKERILQEKQKKKEEKQKEMELKQKEKEMKEEQKKKEKEEKELKRKEKEEKEEIKRKEKEQERIKKQQEIEEKNKEKLREEEKKKKTAALFVNFFVPTKTAGQEEKKLETATESNFMAFEVKSDMKLPLPRRDSLTTTEKESLDNFLENPNEQMSYLKDLKKFRVIRKCGKTWPYEESVVDDDVIAVDLGETICEDKSTLQKFRAKFFKFHENRRPAYYGTWRKKSKTVKARKPLSTDNDLLNYEEDSDDDWEEEEQGESLNGSDDEADNEEEKDDYEVDNDFFVPHGHLSDDEVDDEENARLSPESLKQKLKLLKEEFDQDMKSKTNKLKPRSVGCIWYNKDGSNVDDALNKYLQPLAIISNGQIVIKKRSEIQINQKYRKNKLSKDLDPEHVPIFLKIVQGNSNKKSVVVEQFLQHMEKNGFTVMTSKYSLIKKLKQLATWKKCTDNGPLKNKFCWFINKNSENPQTEC